MIGSEEPAAVAVVRGRERRQSRSELAGAANDRGPGTPARSERDPGARLLVAALAAFLSIPLVIALVVLHQPRWYPLLDWAQTEIRVRDIVSSHPPLIGLAGRIGPFGVNGGSHPGPLSFYALWPVWELFGASAYGLQVANVVLDIAAISLSLWIAYRRGGASLALSIAAVLAVLMRAYGPFMLTSPWNPYLPVLWWFVFLLAAWSLLEDDFAMLPVAVFAGSFCMQTHISYLGLIGGLGIFLIGAIAYTAIRRRHDAAVRKKLWRWGLFGVGLFIVLWVPPVIDQIVHSPGNLRVIRDHFSSPPDPPIGLGDGVNALLTQLNPFKLFGAQLVRDGNQRPVSGARLPGVLLVLVWMASVAGAWRLRVRSLLRLDLVLAVALVLGLISAARIFGDVWFYLLLWAWALAALLLFAIGWTVVAFVRTRLGDARAPNAARAGIAALAAAVVIATAVFALSASHVNVMSPRLNAELGALTSPTVAALAEARDNGQRGPYLVTWLPEAQAIGSEGYGLLNELLRHGFDAYAADVFQPGATRYHVILPGRATLQVHLATGVDIARWRADTRFREVAAFDPRSDAERGEFDLLHAQVVDDLQRAGLNELIPRVDDNLFMLALAREVPEATRRLVSRMLAFGLPAAVFIGPPGEPPNPT